LLILDPFVRLHRIDENASGEVAPLLAYLRELQRRLAAAVTRWTERYAHATRFFVKISVFYICAAAI
jgi:hypothetical protein